MHRQFRPGRTAENPCKAASSVSPACRLAQPDRTAKHQTNTETNDRLRSRTKGRAVVRASGEGVLEAKICLFSRLAQNALS